MLTARTRIRGGLILLPFMLLAGGRLVLSSGALADHKPGHSPPGQGGGGDDGGGGQTLGGTVYATIGTDFVAMDPDGSNKTLLLEDVADAEPSENLHGGQRWFQYVETIPGESYPDGDARVEVLAVAEDGTTVPLTNQPELELAWSLRWSFDGQIVDGLASWIGIHWDLDTGAPIGAGIYAEQVEYDADGNVVGLLAQPDPSAPLIPLGIHEIDTDGDGDGDLFFPNGRHDWAPDGTAITWHEQADDGSWELWVSEWSEPITVDSAFAANPRWSPTGTWIAFEGPEGIERIRPDGSDREIIVPEKQGGRLEIAKFPHWSPTGEHMLFERTEDVRSGGFASNIIRVRSDGKQETDLTNDVPDDFHVGAGGWR